MKSLKLNCHLIHFDGILSMLVGGSGVLSPLSCYRKLLRCFRSANLQHISPNEQPEYRARIRGYFINGIPQKTPEEALVIGMEFANLHINLFTLMVCLSISLAS